MPGVGWTHSRRVPGRDEGVERRSSGILPEAVRAEFFRPEDPETAVAAVEWDGRWVRLRHAADDRVRQTLRKVFRTSPVAVDDPSRRAAGTSGPVVVEPGDLDWFLAAAEVRGKQEGLAVRFATDTPGGWDPAASYQRLGDWVGMKESRAGVAHPTSWK